MEQLFPKEEEVELDGCKRDFTRRGVLQSIGFKEFAPYLALPLEARRGSREGEQLLSEAVERAKIATRQYARRQVINAMQRFTLYCVFGVLSLCVYQCTYLSRFPLSHLSVSRMGDTVVVHPMGDQEEVMHLSTCVIDLHPRELCRPQLSVFVGGNRLLV